MEKGPGQLHGKSKVWVDVVSACRICVCNQRRAWGSVVVSPMVRLIFASLSQRAIYIRGIPKHLKWFRFHSPSGYCSTLFINKVQSMVNYVKCSLFTKCLLMFSQSHFWLAGLLKHQLSNIVLNILNTCARSSQTCLHLIWVKGQTWRHDDKMEIIAKNEGLCEE